MSQLETYRPKTKLYIITPFLDLLTETYKTKEKGKFFKSRLFMLLLELTLNLQT